jgi:hypothetical protein
MLNVAISWSLAVSLGSEQFERELSVLYSRQETLEPLVLWQRAAAVRVYCLTDCRSRDLRQKLNEQSSGCQRDELARRRVRKEYSLLLAMASEAMSVERALGVPSTKDQATLPRWWSPSALSAPRLPVSAVAMDDARGWPLLALRCQLLVRYPAGKQHLHTIGGIELPRSPRGAHWWFGVRALPLIPIWPNFAVNASLYAAAIWFVIHVLRALRRLGRVKRGLCPCCGYDILRDLSQGCPECGWRRKKGENTAEAPGL